MLHMKCFYQKKDEDDKSSLLASENSQTTNEETDTHLCSHDKDEKDKHSEQFRKVGYLLINLVGVVIGVYGIYLIFA